MRRAAVLVFLLSRAAFAQEDAEEGRRLFAEGRAAMDREAWDEAAAKLEASYAKLPGKGVAFNLAVCREHTGKLRGALELYRRVAEAERGAGDEARAKIADDRAASVAARIPRLRVSVPPAQHATVSVDGVPSATSELEMDPGDHTLEVTAPGFVSWHDTVHLAESDHRDVVVSLQAVPSAPVIVIKQPVLPSASTSEARSIRSTAWVTGGLGIASLVAGGAFAITSAALYSQASATCDGTTNVCTSQSGIDLRNQSIAFGDAATGTVIAGVCLVAVGTILWLVDNARHHRR